MGCMKFYLVLLVPWLYGPIIKISHIQPSRKLIHQSLNEHQMWCTIDRIIITNMICAHHIAIIDIIWVRGLHNILCVCACVKHLYARGSIISCVIRASARGINATRRSCYFVLCLSNIVSILVNIYFGFNVDYSL